MTVSLLSSVKASVNGQMDRQIDGQKQFKSVMRLLTSVLQLRYTMNKIAYTMEKVALYPASLLNSTTD